MSSKPFDLKSFLSRGRSGMFFTALDITPEIAHELLALNTHNRPVSRRTVQRYKLDMQNSHWPFTPEPITIDRDAVLQNGQHRLMAVVAANVTVRMTVCWGSPPEALDVVDQGLKRTAAHVAALKGIPNAATITAAVKLVIRYDVMPGLIWTGGNEEVGQANVIAFTEANQSELVIAANVYANVRSGIPRLSPSTTAAAAFLINRDSSMSDEADKFWQGVKTGSNLDPTDVRLLLRNREIMGYNGLSTSSSWRTQLRLALFLKSWNAYIENRPLRVLRFTRQELPMPKVL